MTISNGNPSQAADIDSLLEEVLRNNQRPIEQTEQESKYIVSNGEGEVYYRLDEHMLFGMDEVAGLTLEEAYRVIESVKESGGKTFLYRLVPEEIKDVL